MVLDFMTVAAFILLCAYKLGLTLLSMSASVVASQKYSKFLQESANKSKHADLVKLSPFSLAQKSRQLHQAGV